MKEETIAIFFTVRRYFMG